MIYLAIIVAGFTAMASQIVFMREFLIVFYGNELSIGLILASWLLGGAIGSLLLGRLADRIRSKIIAFSLCQIALSPLLPLGIIAIRSIRVALNINTGEIIPFAFMAISSFLILAPICMMLGFIFSLACRIYESRITMGAVRIGHVYILEAIGAIVGGLLASFVLIRLINPLQIIAILGIANLVTAFFLSLLLRDKTAARAVSMVLAGIMIMVGAIIWLANGWSILDKDSITKQWEGYELLSSKNSIYGNIAIVKRIDQFSFFDNGLHLYTVPDELTSEEAVHYALLEHDNPKDVLLVGGGVGGLVAQILKHHVESVDYVELDPLIINMAKAHLPQVYYKPLEDKRVSIVNEDGRLFIKRSKKDYDCVIIHIGDPYTAQLNRYYTIEFFREVKGILKKGGIISFALTSSENYINKELGDFLRSIHATLREAFGTVKIIPGETAYFLASDESGLLTYDYNLLVDRIKERGIDVKYVREYYLFSKLSPERISYIEDSARAEEGGVINRDFKPISYYYAIISWAARFRDSLFGNLLKILTEAMIWKIMFAIYAIIIASALIGIRYGSFYKKAALVAIMTTGFSEMAFQVTVLLSFQVIYGYVFYKLGLILTSFMIGLALGGLWVIRIMPNIKRDMRSFIWIQAAVSAYPLILPLIFWWLADSKSGYVSWLGSNILFPSLPIIAGAIGGIQFPLANKIYLEKEEDVGRVAGLNYGMDLAGSCLGAVTTGAFLIPILGIPKTCLAVSGLNMAVLGLLVLSRSFNRIS